MKVSEKSTIEVLSTACSTADVIGSAVPECVEALLNGGGPVPAERRAIEREGGFLRRCQSQGRLGRVHAKGVSRGGSHAAVTLRGAWEPELLIT